MHDIRWIRENAAAFDAGLAARGLQPQSERLLGLDDGRKRAIGAAQATQERRNALSKEIGKAKAQKDEPRAQALMAEVAGLRTGIAAAEAADKAAAAELNKALAEIPNLPLPDVPIGADEHGKVEYRRHGAPRRTN